MTSDVPLVESNVTGSNASPLPCEPPPEPPAPIKAALDRRFPGWRFAQVDMEICRFLKEEIAPDARPEIVSGDFDGNGRLDSAVLIEHGTLRDNGGTEYPNVHVVALLNTNRGFKVRTVTNQGPGGYLVTMKKHQRDYDYETQKYFTYSNDAILTGIFEKAGTSYVYENGRFRAIITSD